MPFESSKSQTFIASFLSMLQMAHMTMCRNRDAGGLAADSLDISLVRNSCRNECILRLAVTPVITY